MGSTKDKHGVRERFAKYFFWFAKNGRSRKKEFWSTIIYIYIKIIIFHCIFAYFPSTFLYHQVWDLVPFFSLKDGSAEVLRGQQTRGIKPLGRLDGLLAWPHDTIIGPLCSQNLFMLRTFLVDYILACQNTIGIYEDTLYRNVACAPSVWLAYAHDHARFFAFFFFLPNDLERLHGQPPGNCSISNIHAHRRLCLNPCPIPNMCFNPFPEKNQSPTVNNWLTTSQFWCAMMCTSLKRSRPR